MATTTLTTADVENNVGAAVNSVANIDGESFLVTDIDKNGNVDALTDGLLLLRYAFNLRGDALIYGAVASDATRAQKTSKTTIYILTGFIVGDGNSYSNDEHQQSVYVEGTPLGVEGGSVTIQVMYDATDDTLTGLGLNIHYDSSVLTFEEISEVLLTENFNSGSGPFEDVHNTDDDVNTDKYISFAWASLFGSWPGTGTVPINRNKI